MNQGQSRACCGRHHERISNGLVVAKQKPRREAGFMAIFGLIEGIMYLACSDQRFYDVYLASKKNWF